MAVSLLNIHCSQVNHVPCGFVCDYDDIDVCNPIGSKSAIHKLGVFKAMDTHVKYHFGAVIHGDPHLLEFRCAVHS